MKFNLSEYIRGTYGVGLRLPDLDQKMPSEEFEERVGRLRVALGELGVEVAFAYGDERRPGDVGWITGYDPHIESALVVVGEKKVLVAGGPGSAAYANEMMRMGEFCCLEEFKIPAEEYSGVKFHRLEDVFSEAAGRAPKKVGSLTVGDVIPAAVKQQIKESVGAEMVDCSRWMLEARYKKSPAELEMIAIAAYLSTWGMEALIRSIDPGMRETECAAVAEYVMKYMGADRFGFTTMVNSGLRASNVLGRASNKVIEEGDLVVLGTSARYEGMTAALGRTIVAGGKGNPDKFELIEHCIEANGLSRKGYGFGKPAKEADSAAKEYLKGVGLQSMYSTVHGVGWTECVEGTGEATQHSTYTFAKGIASQIDVGVFGVPFKSLSAKEIGARVEDPFFIDHEGRARRLTSLPANVDHLVFKT